MKCLFVFMLSSDWQLQSLGFVCEFSWALMLTHYEDHYEGTQDEIIYLHFINKIRIICIFLFDF